MNRKRFRVFESLIFRQIRQRPLHLHGAVVISATIRLFVSSLLTTGIFMKTEKRKYLELCMKENIVWLERSVEKPSVGMSRMHVMLQRIAIRIKNR